MNKRILHLALPSILANITIPLVGLVDTAIAGHLSDAAAIGGIAVGTMLFDLLYWNFGFLRVGTSGMTAQALGRGDKDGCAQLLTRTLSIALAAACIIYVVQWLFLTAVMACIPCSDAVADFARHYFYVRIWAAPATLCLMALKGWFIGMQDTVSPMLCDIVVNTVNMAASYVLAVFTPLGVAGVAHGTVVAQFAGLALALVLLLVRYRAYLRFFARLRDTMRWKDLRPLLSLNGNLFVRSLCFMVVYVGFTALASDYGDEMLAISSILMKLFMLFSFFIDGFAYAGEALVGKAVGAGRADDLKRIVRLLFVWSLGLGLFFTGVYAVWGTDCVRLLTNEETLLRGLPPFLPWLIAMPVVSALAFMWDGVYVGATAAVPLRNSMMLSAAGFVASYAALASVWGIQALYVAYFVHLIVRVLYLTFRWKTVFPLQDVA